MATNEELGTLLDYIRENADRLGGDALIRLADTIVRLTDSDGTLRLDHLPPADIDQLWAAVRDVERDNGVRWEVGN